MQPFSSNSPNWTVQSPKPRAPHGASGRMARLALVVALALAGCATPRARMEWKPAGDPAAAEIVAALAARAATIESLQATGDAFLESPDFEAVKRFYGRVAFRKPDRLHLTGMHRTTGIVAARLTCSGDDYFLEFPREREQDVFRFDEQGSGNQMFGASPAAVFGEMLFPEDWTQWPPDAIRVVAADGAAGLMRVEFRREGALERLLLVQGRPWVILEAVRFEDGEPVIRATYEAYAVVDGVPLPGRIVAEFPMEATRLELELRNPSLNALTGGEGLFDVRARLRDAGVQVP